MFSTLLELAGFGVIIAATALLGGLVPALYVAGPVLLLLGYAVEDENAAVALRRATSPVRRRARALRDARLQRRRRRELSKAA